MPQHYFWVGSEAGSIAGNWLSNIIALQSERMFCGCAVERWGGWFLLALFGAILTWEEVWDLPNSAALSAWLLLLITAGAMACSWYAAQHLTMPAAAAAAAVVTAATGAAAVVAAAVVAVAVVAAADVPAAMCTVAVQHVTHAPGPQHMTLPALDMSFSPWLLTTPAAAAAAAANACCYVCCRCAVCENSITA